MTGRPRVPHEGVQLPLFDVGAKGLLTPEQWSAELTLAAELDAYMQRLRADRDYSEKNAEHLRDHLRAAVHQSVHGTARELAADPEGLVRAIQGPKQRATRQKRHQAIQELLTVSEADLPPGAVSEGRNAIEGIGGRSAPLPQFVDRDLGGSTKRVRIRRPFSWDDGAEMIASAAEHASPGATQRDVALATLSGRSGLAPGLITALRWEVVLPILVSSEEVVTVDVQTRHGREPIAFHREAVLALRTLRAASGEPSDGAVFRKITGVRDGLTDGQVKRIVATACGSSSDLSIDRRHIRAPFGWWLGQRGWDEYHVAHSLGFRQVRDLRRLLLPLEEASAQAETTEILTLAGPGIIEQAEGGVRAANVTTIAMQEQVT